MKQNPDYNPIKQRKLFLEKEKHHEATVQPIKINQETIEQKPNVQHLEVVIVKHLKFSNAGGLCGRGSNSMKNSSNHDF